MKVVTAPFLLGRWDDLLGVPIYITNYVALALGLEGYPDPPLSVVQAAVTKTGYAGYVAPDFKAAAPVSTGGTGGPPPPPPVPVPVPVPAVKAARR